MLQNSKIEQNTIQALLREGFSIGPTKYNTGNTWAIGIMLLKKLSRSGAKNFNQSVPRIMQSPWSIISTGS